jgi:hypothetical protein
VLSFDYFRQEKVRKFLADSGRTGRPKAIILDGCVLVHDLVVIGYATRAGSTPEAVRKKHGNLRPLVRTAFSEPQYEPLRDVILGVADIGTRRLTNPSLMTRFRNGSRPSGPRYHRTSLGRSRK